MKIQGIRREANPGHNGALTGAGQGVQGFLAGQAAMQQMEARRQAAEGELHQRRIRERDSDRADSAMALAFKKFEAEEAERARTKGVDERRRKVLSSVL